MNNDFRLGQSVKYSPIACENIGEHIQSQRGIVTSQVMTLGAKTFIGVRWQRDGRFTLTPIEHLDHAE